MTSDEVDCVSFGSTLLNLASTGHPRRGLPKGTYALFVGDSSSGKTWLGRSVLAEASVNKKFADYRLIHGNAENGAWMDIEKYFGPALVERMEDESPYHVEQVYDRLDTLLDEKRPFIYLLDSENALTSEKDDEQVDEERKFRDGSTSKDPGGDYGMHKAKAHSRRLGRVNARLAETGSILIIISQTRQNIGPTARFNPKTRSGGKALKFFAHLEIWTSVREDLQIKLPASSGLNTDKQRKQGVLAKIKIEKNRFTGREGEVEMPIYNSYGIDDLGSMVDFLLEEKHWKKEGGGYITCPELDGIRLQRSNLLRHIYEEDLVVETQKIVTDVWRKIEAATAIDRGPRYE